MEKTKYVFCRHCVGQCVPAECTRIKLENEHVRARNIA